MKWTDEQRRVIEARNKNLLVSAAAGSGKTAVLTARIISLITDREDPVDIDRMLVLTFTEAAAAEMKERIGKALKDICDEDPENDEARKQSVYLGHAHISTVHSFCSYVIKNYFHTTGVDPSCRVMDDAERSLLISRVIEELLDKKYEEQDAELLFFEKTFFPEKNADRQIAGLIRKIYDFAAAAPWPALWLEKAVETMEEAAGDPANAEFFKAMTARAAEEALAAYRETERLLRLAEGPGGPAGYIPALKSDLEMYRLFLAAEGPDEKRTVLETHPFAGLSSGKGKDEDPALREYIKNARNRLRADIEAVRKETFSSDTEEVKKELEFCLPLVRAVCSLTRSFIAMYEETKQARGVMDFSDMEHYALDILVERAPDGRLVRTDAAKELSSFFRAVMTDEYQDTNDVQELILWSVSGEEDGIPDRFMVGDIKQAIYGFRHARPEIFKEKYISYASGGEDRERIDLNRNFRSRSSVISFVNAVFKKLMSAETGGIDYDEKAALVYGDVYEGAGEDPAVEILLADKKDTSFPDSAGADRYAEAEARMAAGRIKELMRSMRVSDKETGEMRPLRYSDCAILMRSVSSVSNIYTRVLSGEGIPAYAPLRTGYFGASEVSVMLDYLRIIDNPAQDIPLTAALFSPIGGLNTSELTLIRVSGKGAFHKLCREYARLGGNEGLRKKLQGFFELLDHFRKTRLNMPVHRIIREVRKKTGFGICAASMPGGIQRAANLKMLESRAMEFEKRGGGGLFLFIRYIEEMRKEGIDFGEAGLFAKGADAVAVTSIHRSKGLEYPVVFLCGCARKFNITDLNSQVLLGYEQGMGIDAVNAAAHAKKSTLYKRAVRFALEKDLYGEEQRVLYVAMTRAREKLVITGVADDLEKQILNCAERKARWKDRIPGTDVLKASSYLDWILMTLANDECFRPLYRWAGLPDTDGLSDGAAVKIRVESAGHAAEELADERRREAGAADGLPSAGDDAIYDENVKKILSGYAFFEYPYSGSADVPAKISVSELKRLSYEGGSGDEGEAFAEEKTVIPYIPGFIRKREEKLTAAEAGTAFHKLLEAIDLKGLGDGEVTRAEALYAAEKTADLLLEKGRFSEDERRAVNTDAAADLILSGLGRRMRLADCEGVLKREMPFTMSVPAAWRGLSFKTEEPVLIQGIIDAYFTEDGKNILVDYKTDRTDSEGELIKRYRTQLLCYAQAIEKAAGGPVAEAVIYSVHLGRAVKVPL